MWTRGFALTSVSALVLCAVLSSPSSAGEAPAPMQAIVVADGKPQVQQVPRPAAGPGQVLVRVRAAGVNPADWKRAERAPNSAVTPGWDIAGVISAVGPGVSGWKVG